MVQRLMEQKTHKMMTDSGKINLQSLTLKHQVKDFWCPDSQ